MRLLVLTHFSQRYESGPDGDKRLAGEAAAVFGGEVVLARDLDRIPVPPRRGTGPLDRDIGCGKGGVGPWIRSQASSRW